MTIRLLFLLVATVKVTMTETIQEIRDSTKKIIGKLPKSLRITTANILSLEVDLLVNPCNYQCTESDFPQDKLVRKAGGKSFVDACDALKPDRYGQKCPAHFVVVLETAGMGELKSDYVLQASIPDCNQEKVKNLWVTYLEVLYEFIMQEVDKRNLKTVALPLLSAGVLGCDYKEAIDVAVEQLSYHRMRSYNSKLEDFIFLMSESEVSNFVQAVKKRPRLFSRDDEDVGGSSLNPANQDKNMFSDLFGSSAREGMNLELNLHCLPYFITICLLILFA